MNPFPFTLPADGWYQICALGEFAHSPTGLTQIMDEPACRAIMQRFQQEATAPNFPGVLVDFDHFSLEQDKPSAAAGWISALDFRPGSGLWAQIRWSDAGLSAVQGGRYRFISPVWRQDECEPLGNARVRPRHLCNAALTNDPNISGMVPLSNSRRRISLRLLRNSTPVAQMAPMQRKAAFARMAAGGSPSATTPPGIRPLAPPRDWRQVRRKLSAKEIARLNHMLDVVRGLVPYAIRNRMPFAQMSPEQKRAMFARLNSGVGGGATDDVTSARSRYQQDQTSLDDYERDLRAGGHLDEPTIKKLRGEKENSQLMAHYRQDQTDLEDYRRDLEAHGSLDTATIDKLVAEKEKRQEEEGMSAWDQRVNERIARQVAEDKQRKAAEQPSEPPTNPPSDASAPEPQSEIANPKSPTVKPYQYDLDRARTALTALEAQAAEVGNQQLPAKPTPRTFEQVDLHKMRWDLIQKGVDPVEADQQVAEQRQVNEQHAQDLRDIKSRIRKQYKTSAQRKAALARELNKVSTSNDRNTANYQKAVQTKSDKTAGLSSRIAAEKARIDSIVKLQGP
ncbi:MAG: hypothetical protein NTY53_23560 [Kiritimatiellaeota bacterium]|nr:hypothetical protein [Kiritimatiellota bacterium]